MLKWQFIESKMEKKTSKQYRFMKEELGELDNKGESLKRSVNLRLARNKKG